MLRVRHGTAAVDRDAGHGRRPGGRVSQAGEDPQGRRLAGPVRSQEAEDRAGRDLEVQVVQGQDPADAALVPLGEALGRDGGRGAGTDPVASRRVACRAGGRRGRLGGGALGGRGRRRRGRGGRRRPGARRRLPARDGARARWRCRGLLALDALEAAEEDVEQGTEEVDQQDHDRPEQATVAADASTGPGQVPERPDDQADLDDGERDQDEEQLGRDGLVADGHPVSCVRLPGASGKGSRGARPLTAGSDSPRCRVARTGPSGPPPPCRPADPGPGRAALAGVTERPPAVARRPRSASPDAPAPRRC